MTQVGEIIWEAGESRKQQSCLYEFIKLAQSTNDQKINNWDDLFQWSINHSAAFWDICSQYVKIKWKKSPTKISSPSDQEISFFKTQWFPDATLNFAENLLPDYSDQTILTSIQEGLDTHYYSGKDLWNLVYQCQIYLKSQGVQKGDRVAGVICNGMEAIVAMLATTSLGATWSSCSPDFGAQGILDRFGQIEPKILFFSAEYQYNGKLHSCSEAIKKCKDSITSIKKFIIIDKFQNYQSSGSNEIFWHEIISTTKVNGKPDIEFVETNFDHPVYIMFSSGTTGLPKCIIHGAGGTLLQHKKELLLHTDVKKEDKVFYFTTCGWMMWNWMVSTLSTGASLLVFDGSPTYPNFEILWKIIEQEHVTIVGTSPKYIQACINQNLSLEKFNLSHLKTMLSTGSPLLPEHFQWIYQNIKSDLHLASISGGTDIISCFLLGNLMLPVRVGYLQSPGLGMAVESWNELGHKVTNEKAELVCTRPFVSMPVGFWNDPDKKKYHEAYFEKYENKNIWAHGDFIEINANGAMILGRSDATLNPGGVRIGTAEIYRQVETLDFIEDSIAIGFKTKDDTEIVLFVKPKSETIWDTEKVNHIKKVIKDNLTPRHIPKYIFPVLDIPYTRSGKKVEIAVTKAFHGEEVKNQSALANPESLKIFYDLGTKLHQPS